MVNSDPGPALACRGLVVELGRRRVLDGIDLHVETGGWVTIVGPNGAGKSTLLRAVAGLVAPAAGNMLLGGRPVTALSPRERARAIALVPQTPIVPAGLAVIDYVLLGRTPHLGPLAAEGAHDLAVAHGALEQLDLTGLARRRLAELSGGERQRAVLARALAQEAPLLLLDEPTAGLDIGHQAQVLELIDDLRRCRGLTVVATMHDLTTAGQYADALVLLDGGKVAASGRPEAVLTAEVLERHYGMGVEVLHHHGRVIVVAGRQR